MDNKKITDILMESEIKKAIQYYGIELTEDKIRKVYHNMPYLKYSMLKMYFKITNREEQWKQMKK